MAIESTLKIYASKKIAGSFDTQMKGKANLICGIRIDPFILAEPLSHITRSRNVSNLEHFLQIVHFPINIVCIAGKTICTQERSKGLAKTSEGGCDSQKFFFILVIIRRQHI